MKNKGIIKNINFDKLNTMLASEEERKRVYSPSDSEFEAIYADHEFSDTISISSAFGGNRLVSYGSNEHKGKCWYEYSLFYDIWRGISDMTANGKMKCLQEQFDYAQKYEQPLHYVYANALGYFVELVDHTRILLPKETVEVEAYKDYSDVAVSLIGANEDLAKCLPSVGEETQTTLKGKLENKKAEIEGKMQEIENLKEKQNAEIEAIKREIEEKYRKSFELINEKKKELEVMKEQLEGQLFVLDTQIYGIRCFFGETVNFTKLVSGKDSPSDTPLVMYQKIRFLDEELAKYASLYNFDGDDTEMFEELIKNREDMRDLFFPKDKSISLVRISRDRFKYKSRYSTQADACGSVTISKVLEKYEVYHGNQIAILVRNGDNCYVGWTELDRIAVSGDNAFLAPRREYEDDAVSADRRIGETATSKEEVAARYFIFSIAQGLLENSKIINLPEKASLLHGSPYIVFSMADGWIGDNTYGSFDDIMDKCSKNMVKKGDTILTLTHLRAEGKAYESYSNDRGRGYTNRTHDVSASDNTLYAINLVEDDEYKNIATCEYKMKSDKKWRTRSFSTSKDEKSFEEEFYKSHDTKLWEYRNFQFKGRKKHVFISLEKNDTWYRNMYAKSTARANFELYSDEYIDLTFLNTEYIRYIITNRKMPHRYVGGKTFSDLLPYLNKAMDYLKEREKKEAEMLSPYMELTDGWQVALSEWRLGHNYHSLTPTRAKAFAGSKKEKV